MSEEKVYNATMDYQVDDRILTTLSRIERYMKNDPERSLYFCRILADIGTSRNDAALCAKEKELRGKALLNLNMRKESYTVYKEALSWYSSNHDYAEISRILNIMGAIYQMEESPEQALTFYKNAVRYAKTAKRPELEFRPLFNIALVYIAGGNEQKALQQYQKAYYAVKDIPDTEDLGSVCISIATLYKKYKNYREAILWFGRAQEHAKAEDARQTFASATYGLSQVEVSLGSYTRAKKRLEALYTYSQRHELQVAEALTVILLSSIYFREKKIGPALKMLQDVLSKIRKAPKRYTQESYLVCKQLGDYHRFIKNDSETAEFYYAMYISLTKGTWKRYLTN